YAGKSLIDQYDVYQHLLSYWLETMKDDVYMLGENGWQAEVTELVRKKGDKKVEGTIKVGKQEFICELLPKELLIDRYFATERDAIEKLELEKEAKSSELDELVEEHAGEEGLMAEVTGDNGKVSKGNVDKRVKALKKAKGDDDADELAVLEQYLEISGSESAVGKKIKSAEATLAEKLLTQYDELSEDDVKTLVVDDKWMATIGGSVATELSDISQSLTSRVSELAERYSRRASELEEQVAELANKVDAHLAAMGFSCK
ncbi:MAG: type I restriction endonuclease subunit M, partial [Pirellulaceae bacterium]